MTPRLVDGMNVIGSRPDGWWRDRTAAMARLASLLAARAQATGEEVVLVLDGRPRDLGEHPGVAVRFAAHADDLLVELAVEAPGTPVVTSDRALAGRLRRAGARVEPSGPFRARLEAAGR